MNKMNALHTALASVDQDYIVALRREIHEYPELGFDCPKTLAVIRRELESMGIGYTEQYGKSAIVATIQPNKAHYTIGIRADMDALPLQEKTDLPFRSKIDGQMHACGHDSHTAMLLGTAKALKTVEDDLDCRVMLVFQPSEENGTGAKFLVEDGLMDEIDVIICLHVENWLESGTIGVCIGDCMAGVSTITIEFFGKTAHATMPHSGKDALAMAVSAYNNIQLMLAREMDPFKKWVCSVGQLSAGTTHNVVADHALMKISLRTYEVELSDYIERRIEQICAQTAESFGGTYRYCGGITAYPVYNDPDLSKEVLASIAKVIGEENIAEMPLKMSSEDFSFYQTKKPGVLIRLGTKNAAKGCVTLPHNNDFLIDEDAFHLGCKTCVQFVFDHMR